MTNTVTIPADYLELLEKLADECRRWNMDGSHSADRRLALVIEAIPPKPVELIELEGWESLIEWSGNVCYVSWACGGSTITVETRPTEREAILAANAMLWSIVDAMKGVRR